MMPSAQLSRSPVGSPVCGAVSRRREDGLSTVMHPSVIGRLVNHRSATAAQCNQ